MNGPKSLAIGEPIKIETLPPSPRGHDWKSLLDNIPKGYAQLVSSHYGTTKAAIQRLESVGMIPKGEFTLRIMKRGDKRELYILHSKDRGKEPRRSMEPRTSLPKLKRSDIEEFIMSKPDYEHSLLDVQMKFAGKALSSRSDKTDYHRIYNMTRKARKEIEHRVGNKFQEKLRADGVKIYRIEDVDLIR